MWFSALTTRFLFQLWQASGRESHHVDRAHGNLGKRGAPTAMPTPSPPPIPDSAVELLNTSRDGEDTVPGRSKAEFLAHQWHGDLGCLTGKRSTVCLEYMRLRTAVIAKGSKKPRAYPSPHHPPKNKIFSPSVLLWSFLTSGWVFSAGHSYSHCSYGCCGLGLQRPGLQCP